MIGMEEDWLLARPTKWVKEVIFMHYKIVKPIKTVEELILSSS